MLRLLAMSCRNLMRNRRRTTITLLGLVVGLTAVNIFQGYMKDALDGLRPIACSNKSHDHRPSSAAFHTASPCSAVTAFTPCCGTAGSRPPLARRSTMH